MRGMPAKGNQSGLWSYVDCMYRGAVVWWLNMQTHNAGVVSSILPCITIKTPLMRKATGNHVLKNPLPLMVVWSSG